MLKFELSVLKQTIMTMAKASTLVIGIVNRRTSSLEHRFWNKVINTIVDQAPKARRGRLEIDRMGAILSYSHDFTR
jgi:hypothetical protein